MCTKWFSDGDVHKYFNPYDTPYEAFINYMNILSDFILRIDSELLTNRKEGELSTYSPEEIKKMINDYELKISELMNLSIENKPKKVRKSTNKGSLKSEIKSPVKKVSNNKKGRSKDLKKK